MPGNVRYGAIWRTDSARSTGTLSGKIRGGIGVGKNKRKKIDVILTPLQNDSYCKGTTTLLLERVGGAFFALKICQEGVGGKRGGQTLTPSDHISSLPEQLFRC